MILLRSTHLKRKKLKPFFFPNPEVECFPAHDQDNRYGIQHELDSSSYGFGWCHACPKDKVNQGRLLASTFDFQVIASLIAIRPKAGDFVSPNAHYIKA